MESVLAQSVLSRGADKAVDSIWRQIGYIWNYKDNIQDLKKQLQKLKDQRLSMQHSVDQARRNGEEIEDMVTNWLKSADESIKEAEENLKHIDRANKSCFMGCYPNPIDRYQLSRKAKKVTPAVAAVEGERNSITKISYLDVRELEPAKDDEVLASRMESLKDIVEALKNVDVNLIGVYGLGGTGKTTLVKQQVVAQVKEEGIFKMVPIANVTHTWNLNKIQQEIADWLQLKFNVESTEVRAAQLRARLKKEEKVLVILDDIWVTIKLEEIGIPNDHKGCKILMTSRNLNVLLEMGVQRHFLLQVLGEEEAWQLFEKKAGDHVKNSGLQSIAIQVAKRCAGLPVLIVAVATTLKNKEFFEWNDALEQLEKFDDKGIEAQVYSALELSYKFLGDDEKSLLLLCAQLSPQAINITDLLKYGMGLGLFSKFATVRVARNRLLKLINDLKKSCLLLEGDDNEYGDNVKMHDVVHSFAGSIAAKERGVFTRANHNYVLEDWPEKDAFEECTAICLRDCQILKLSQEIECPQLEPFILYNKDSSLKIPENFFRGMKKLKLMDLSDVHLCPLPLSIQSLENLMTLCLDRCDLENIAAIGELKKLQVLSLNGSTIVQLPMEIRNLTRLQLLDLSRCERLEVIPPNVLSCLTKLEDLYMGNSFTKWEGEGDYVRGDNASLSELKKLSNLMSLDLHIVDAKIIPEGLFSKKLDRFRIFIGEEWEWSDKYETMRTLKLKVNTSIELQLERVKVALMRTEDLYLDDMKGVKNMLPELEWEGFPQLKHLQLQNSREIKYIIDCVRIRNVIAFPRLESLSLENLNKLEKIWNGPLRKGSFSNLRKLQMRNCNLLKNVFSLSMVRELSMLEEIDVSSCRSMQEIVSDECEDDETIKLSQLHSLRLEDLQLFAGFCSQKINNISTTNVAAVFCKKIQFPNLVGMKLSLNNVEKIWDDQLIELCPFEKLTTLMIDGCGNLANLFTSSMVGSLKQLKALDICNCNCLDQVIITQADFEEIIFPKVESLKMSDLPNLMRFCSGNLIECQSLKVLRIENCPRLQAFISSRSTVHQGKSTLFNEKVLFHNLEAIFVSSLRKLKMIWNNEVRADSFCRLEVVRVEHCKQLLKVFPSELLTRFQSIESLILRDCDLLEEVFDLEMLIKLKEKHEYDGDSVTQLRDLDIRILPKLKHVWNQDPQGILSFENLSSVVVLNCPILESVFPASVARNLIRLETLDINDRGLEEIVAKEKEFETNRKFVLPRLKTFSLWMLPQLQRFYNGIHTLECPDLQVLMIYCCDKVYFFFHTSGSTRNMSRDPFPDSISATLSFFNKVGMLFNVFLQAVNLEELSIKNSDISKLQRGQFPLPHVYKLKVVHLHFLDDELPFDFLVKFQNLDTLIIENCDFKGLFPYDMGGEVAITLSRIQHLTLDWIPYIRHVWNQESQPDQFLQNLQTLEIWNCHSLISLAPSSASFQNLSVLDVHLCERMLNLISSSTALSLVNLTSMSVGKCEEVTEIIMANKGDESQFQSDEIIFRKLATLKLHCLKSLIYFCSATCTIKFPSLEEVYVSQCPRLKIFSQGDLSAPKLKRVYVTEGWDKWRWIGDLNTTIKQLYTEMVGFNAIQHLKLSEFPQLKEVWHDQLPINFFYNLSTLVIDECGSFPISVPSSLLRFLNNLEELEVRNCNSVEQAFGFEWPNGNEHLGYLSNLNSLRLIDLPRLSCIWNEVPEGILDLRNLKMLKFHGCSSLKYIFTPTMSSCLVQLKEVEVKSCVMVEAIITKGLAKGAADNIIFPVLNSISLESLPSLISFNSGNRAAECPSLKQITVADCPSKFCGTFLRELGASVANEISELKVLSPCLEELKLLLVDTEKIWHTPQLEMSSVQNLTSLIVDGCGNLKYLLSLSMIKSIVQLKRLEICDCKMLEEVIVMEEFEEKTMNIKLFLQDLDFLKLQDLPKLTDFCTCNLIECPALKELWIQNCPQLTTFAFNFSSANIAASSGLELLNSTLFDEKVMFPNLEEMQMQNMDNLKTIWQKELHSNSFCRIKVLNVEDVKQAVKIFPPSMLRSLEELVIRNCESVEEVFDLQELMNMKETVVSQLRTLDIDNLPNLKHVWNEDPLGFVSFHHLNSVYVRDCPCLKTLFPTSVAKGLSQLETLNIDGCGLKEVIGKAEDAKATPKFVFPRLKSLDLWRLQQLRCLYPGTHTLECPVLERLQVYDCTRLEIFTSESINLPEMHLESQLEKVVTNLEHLSLPIKDATTMSQVEVPGNLFHKLKSININCFHDEFAVFPVDLLQKLQNIEKLAVWCCDFKELFPYEGLVDKKKHVKTLAKIEHLELELLPHVKHIWNQHTQPDQVLPNLKSLIVKRCDSLISLASSSSSFQNLTTLDVMKCNSLVSLVTPSTAKSLGQLRKMSIQECNMVKEIIAGEGDESKEEIIFRRLESLQLNSLPNLVSFCWEEHTFRFPCLTQVSVKQCPKMHVFSKGALSTPLLRRVQVTEEENKNGRWNINLNSTIQQLFAEMGN